MDSEAVAACVSNVALPAVPLDHEAVLLEHCLCQSVQLCHRLKYLVLFGIIPLPCLCAEGNHDGDSLLLSTLASLLADCDVCDASAFCLGCTCGCQQHQQHHPVNLLFGEGLGE